MTFQVPELLKRSIDRDQAVSSEINHALSSLFLWFQDNKLFFFPEYTDHGVDHINTVLASAAELITPDAQNVLTPQDSAAIVGAVLLHDCAMHLSWDGFLTLLSGQYSAQSSLADPGEKPWPELFAGFMHEAHRWDESKLESLFGSVQLVRQLPKPFQEVTEADKRVVGEFLRRHHARLAHEIAHLGVPGPLDQRANWITPFRSESLPADLIGFIARSHNLSIREAKDRLPRLRRREFSGIHAPYVMAILRIADFMQIQSRRAHPSLLSTRSLSSSISVSEWRKHAATVDMHRQGDDPEALVVFTEPTDVSTLFGLRRLFHSIQQELDETWATLGEVYGLMEKLDGLAFRGLTVRRIRTNLDDLSSFETEQKPTFVPVELKLRSAGADMLALLVKPLYDGDPTVAIRELVQNAVDACAERVAYDSSRGVEAPVPAIDVRLEFEGDHGFLEVKDNGIGMTLDTVRDFFLVAGASFRRSQWWKEHFQSEEGRATVRRSGRFGIGALASFLAGPTTIVTTRHVDDRSGLGIQFTYRVDDRHVEARKVAADVGTTIRVEITDSRVTAALRDAHTSPSRHDESRLHWYGLEAPHVSMTITQDGKPEKVARMFSVPSPDAPLPNNWYLIEHPEYKAIHWSFTALKEHLYSYPRPWLLCNGFLVTDGWYRDIDLDVSPSCPTLGVDTPTLSVFDPDGYLPLNLSRQGLADKDLPFVPQLRAALADWLVNAVVEKCGQPGFSLEEIDELPNLASRSSYRVLSRCTVLTSEGACLADPGILYPLNLKRILLILESEVDQYEKFINGYLGVPGSAVAALTPTVATKTDVERLFRSVLRSESTEMEWLRTFTRIEASRISCARRVLDIAREKGRIPKYMFDEWDVDESDVRANLVRRSAAVVDLELTYELPRQSAFVVEHLLSPTAHKPNSPLSTAWFERFPGQPGLPLGRS